MFDRHTSIREISQAHSSGFVRLFYGYAPRRQLALPARLRTLLPDVLLLAGPFLLYAGSIAVLQRRPAGTIWDGPILPDGSDPIQIAAFLIALAATFLLTHLIPGLPWVLCFFCDKNRDQTFDLLAKSFLVTTAGYVFLITTSKVVLSQPVTRAAFLTILGGMTIAGALIASRRRLSICQIILAPIRDSRKLALTSIWMTLLVSSVWQLLLFGMFNGDGIEVFYLAKSLRSEVLPTIPFSASPTAESLAHWNVTLIPVMNSFLRLPSQLLLGDTELATRFPVVGALLCLPAILGRFSTAFAPGRSLSTSAHLVILSGLLSYCLYAVLICRNPIIEPPDISYGYYVHFAAFAYLSLYYLAIERLFLFGLFAAAASLTRWHEFAYFLVPFAMSHAILFRRSIGPLVWAVLSIGLLYIALAVALWLRGDLEYNFDIAKAEQAGRLANAIGLWISGHFKLDIPWVEILLVGGGMALIPPLFPVRFRSLDVLSYVVLFFFISIVVVVAPELTRERLHYFSPAILLPTCLAAIYVLRCPHHGIGRIAPYVALALAICSSLVVYSWRAEPTGLREAARRTALIVDDIEHFVRSPARGRFHVALIGKGLMAKGLEYDLLWVHYIDTKGAPGPQHSVVIADRPIGSACMRLLDQAGPYFLYVKSAPKGC